MAPRMKQKATLGTQKAPVLTPRSASCAGGRRPKPQEPKTDNDKPEKGKTVYDAEWSVSSDSECSDDEAKPRLSKKKSGPAKDAAPAPAVEGLAAKDAAPAAAVEAVAAKDAAKTDAVEAKAAKDAGGKHTAPALSVEAQAAEEAQAAAYLGDDPGVALYSQMRKGMKQVHDFAVLTQAPLSPSKEDIGSRSPSPAKLERDFVPSSISPVNAPKNASPEHTVCCIESLKCNETMPAKMSAAAGVTWHTPLVWSGDGPASKRAKTSREGTPKTPEH